MGDIYTIGHSNRSIDILLELLQANDIKILADIRAFPRSRRHPRFDRGVLTATLASHAIDYRWFGDALGGFRKPRAQSPHTALTDAAFRGFADYMRTAKFNDAIADLVHAARQQRLAIMCAEADYRHCHRQFIADHLQRMGLGVIHILSARERLKHLPNACLNIAAQPPVYNIHDQGDLFA